MSPRAGGPWTPNPLRIEGDQEEAGREQDLEATANHQPFVGRELEEPVPEGARASGPHDELDEDEEVEELGPGVADVLESWMKTNRRKGLHNQDGDGQEHHDVLREHLLARVSRRPVHDVRVGGREAQGQRGQAVRDEVDIEDGRREKGQASRPEGQGRRRR